MFGDEMKLKKWLPFIPILPAEHHATWKNIELPVLFTEMYLWCMKRLCFMSCWLGLGDLLCKNSQDHFQDDSARPHRVSRLFDDNLSKLGLAQRRPTFSTSACTLIWSVTDWIHETRLVGFLRRVICMDSIPQETLRTLCAFPNIRLACDTDLFP